MRGVRTLDLLRTKIVIYYVFGIRDVNSCAPANIPDASLATMRHASAGRVLRSRRRTNQFDPVRVCGCEAPSRAVANQRPIADAAAPSGRYKVAVSCYVRRQRSQGNKTVRGSRHLDR